MLYNNKLGQFKTMTTCLYCEYFDKYNKKCNGGVGKVCFECDPKTMTLFDPVTRLPINPNSLPKEK